MIVFTVKQEGLATAQEKNKESRRYTEIPRERNWFLRGSAPV
jgi:hypothetical protein